ncbi:MAG TPA: TetR/AcrR family transcriptional regulator [Micromonosporaceae bacterium]|jgi:AcrR family transcriptional regulator
MPYDSRRRQEAARRNRAAVLAACQELLFSDGFDATTIRGVAERAGVSPELIYKTFGGKAGLMKALWDVTLAGDDDPAPMARRHQLREVWETAEPRLKLNRYAGFVRDVNERITPLYSVLARSGVEVASVLAVSEQERLIGVTAFVEHAAPLRSDAQSRARCADACWVLTGPDVFIQLTSGRGWSGDAYQAWLAGMLATTLSYPPINPGASLNPGAGRVPDA